MNSLLSTRKRTILASSRTVLYAMIVHRHHDSSFCFWLFERTLTQKNCFLFCKKYGLLNSFIFLNNREILIVPLSKFYCQRSGGQNFSDSYLKQSCLSHGESSAKDRTFHVQEKLPWKEDVKTNYADHYQQSRLSLRHQIFPLLNQEGLCKLNLLESSDLNTC